MSRFLLFFVLLAGSTLIEAAAVGGHKAQCMGCLDSLCDGAYDQGQNSCASCINQNVHPCAASNLQSAMQILADH